MKYIMLDIDGVLNCSAMNWSRKFYNEVNDFGSDKMYRVSTSRINNLNTITNKTGAKIVISSTWRKYFEFDELCNFLYRAGVTGEIIGVTPDISGRGVFRGNEIQLWIEDNIPWNERDNFNYVILDDDSDMLYWQRNNMIIVDRECGLSIDAAYKAIRILERK